MLSRHSPKSPGAMKSLRRGFRRLCRTFTIQINHLKQPAGSRKGKKMPDFPNDPPILSPSEEPGTADWAGEELKTQNKQLTPGLLLWLQVLCPSLSLQWHFLTLKFSQSIFRLPQGLSRLPKLGLSCTQALLECK